MNHKTHRGTVSITCSRSWRQEAGMEAANRVDAQVWEYFVDAGELSLVDLRLRSLSCHGCVQTADAHRWMDAQRVGPHLPRSARPSVLVIEPFTGAPRLSFPTCNISTFFFNFFYWLLRSVQYTFPANPHLLSNSPAPLALTLGSATGTRCGHSRRRHRSAHRTCVVSAECVRQQACWRLAAIMIWSKLLLSQLRIRRIKGLFLPSLPL